MSSVGPLQQMSWQVEDYSLFHKCGEISVSPDIQCFGINCRFCNGLCLQFDVFIGHMRESHHQEIINLYSVTVEKEDFERLQQTFGKVTTYTPNPSLSSGNLNETANPKATYNEKLSSNSLELDLNLEIPKTMGNGQQISSYQIETPPSTTAIVEPLKQELPFSLSYSNEDTVTSNHLAFNESENPFSQPYKANDDTHPSPSNVSIDSSDEDMTVSNDSDELHSHIEVLKSKKKKTIQKLKPVNKFKEISKYIYHHKDVIIYLIQAYKNEEHLWNPNHPAFKHNAKHTLFKDLSEKLHKEKQFPITANEVSDLINLLRNRFTHELKKSLAFECPEDYTSSLWCFKNLLFLKDVVKVRKPTKKRKISCEDSANSTASTYRTIDKDLLNYLLSFYETEPALWNPKDPNYKKNSKNELFEQLSRKLFEDMQIIVSGEEFSNEIEKLRIRYRRELRLVIEHKGLYVSKLWFFDKMKFLKPIFTDQILKKIDKRSGFHSSRKKPKIAHISPINFVTDYDQSKFIEIYKTYPALWNVEHPDYRSTTYREKALHQMLDEINISFSLSSSLEELERTISVFRKKYSDEKLIRLTNKEDSTSIAKLIVYEFIESHIGPFKCDVCDEIINTSDQFKMHKYGHDGIQPFICTICGKGFQMPGNLSVHIRRHKRDYPYSCSECHKTFATSTEVIIHRRSHTGERPYTCDVCQKSYKTWSFYDIHRRVHLNQSTFHCPICEKGFYEKNRYTDHMNGHLNIRKHLCNVCGKSFTTYGNLRKHIDLHSLEKKYKCSTCGKKFAQYAGLRWHRRKYHSLVVENSKENEE